MATHATPLESTTAAVERVRLAGAMDGPLLFAAVREDPLLEIEALRPAFGGRLAVVSSGGCTALSLLASGARRVVAVDANATQNHLLELKHAAAACLGPADATAFLGLAPATPRQRREHYTRLRGRLTAEGAQHWDDRPGLVERGIHHAGRSEHFIRWVVLALRAFVHPPRRIRRLLDCASLEEQRRFLAAEWNNRRFRLLYRLLLSRTALAQGLDPRCVAQTPERRPDRVFLRLFERAMETLPVGENYFLHEMLTGRYPASACPPYLSRDGAALLARGGGGLTLVDGGFTDFLRTQPARSLDGYALSNVCEWLAPADVQLLFAEVRRTARPGAVVVFRNFVGWTEVPAQLAAEIVEDRPRGEALIARDRSLLQRRIAVCRVRPAPAVGPSGSVRVREARAADNAALLRLAAGCPMEGDLTLCIERAPDFFALTHVEGDRTRLRVAESPGGLVGCVALAERTSHLDGRPARTLYAGDLKVAAPWRGQGVADALVADICELACRRGDAETPVLLTVLAGNHNMERRLDGPRGLPPLTRLATVRSLALPALRRRQRVEPWGIRAARPADVEAMLALWGRVAPQRQFAPVHWTPEAFVRRSESLPGFGLSAYRLAHDGAGRLQGFLGVWEQSSLKQLRVVADSPRLARSRRALQLLGPVLGLPPLPHAGQILRCATVFGLCVPSDQPGVLHALLRHALHELRGAGIGVLNLALDVRDPLVAGSRGLFAQPTLIHAYVCRPAGRWQGPPLDGRPLHLETALA